jgi:hypothetical protein
MFRSTAILVTLVLVAGIALAEATTKTFGKPVTLKESNPISKLNTEPDNFKDKPVLVTGKIVDMCAHSGCWVEVLAPDSSRIICKSMDESVHFSKDCLGQIVQVQGKLMVDAKAKNTTEVKKHEGEGEAHACPAPKVMVSLEGATVQFTDAEKK